MAFWCLSRVSLVLAFSALLTFQVVDAQGGSCPANPVDPSEVSLQYVRQCRQCIQDYEPRGSSGLLPTVEFPTSEPWPTRGLPPARTHTPSPSPSPTLPPTDTPFYTVTPIATCPPIGPGITPTPDGYPLPHCWATYTPSPTATPDPWDVRIDLVGDDASYPELDFNDLSNLLDQYVWDRHPLDWGDGGNWHNAASRTLSITFPYPVYITDAQVRGWTDYDPKDGYDNTFMRVVQVDHQGTWGDEQRSWVAGPSYSERTWRDFGKTDMEWAQPSAEWRIVYFSECRNYCDIRQNLDYVLFNYRIDPDAVPATQTPLPTNTAVPPTNTPAPTSTPNGYIDCLRPEDNPPNDRQIVDPDAFADMSIAYTQCYRVLPYIHVGLPGGGGENGEDNDLLVEDVDLCIDFYTLPKLEFFGFEIDLQILAVLPLFWFIRRLSTF